MGMQKWSQKSRISSGIKTCYMSGPGNLPSSKTNHHKAAAYAFAETASCFAPYTNVFAPYYTQLPVNVTNEQVAQYFTKYNINPSILAGGYLDMLTYTQVRTDVYAALDYYFEHLNNGRPFTTIFKIFII